jgi:hypothetical protein
MTSLKIPLGISEKYKGESYLKYLNEYKNENKNSPVSKLIDLYVESIKLDGLYEKLLGNNGLANDRYQTRENFNSYDYGFYDIHEFLAEGFTNYNFQQKLKSLRSENRNIWDKFIDFIKDIFGIENRDLLTDILMTGNEIIRSTRPPISDIAYGEDANRYSSDYKDLDSKIKSVINRSSQSITNKQLFDSVKKITGLDDQHINNLIEEVRGKNTSEQNQEKKKDERAEPNTENIDDYEMTTSGEINRFLSGNTWDDVFGEKAEGDQNYLTQKLSDMLQDGKNMIAIAQQKWGGDVMMYAKPLFQLIQGMSNDKQMSNKKAVLLATLLGELQEAKKRSPERFDAISQIEKAVFAYYQNYMNVRGKEIVAGRLLRLYRDKYIGDIYADRILEKEQVKAKKAIQEIEQNKQIDDKTASEETKPITEEEKKKEDKAAKKKSEAAKKIQSKKKKMTNEEAKQRADSKVMEIEEKMGKDGRGGLINRIKEAIKKLNCK